MHKLRELRDMLMREIDGCVQKSSQKGELLISSIDMLDKMTHMVKSIDTILAMEDYSYDEYKARRRSSSGRYMEGGYNRNQYSEDYNEGYNEGYNRGRNQYSGYNEGYNRGQYNEGSLSRRYGHDEAKAELVNKLRSMEMNAENEEQRKMIRHWISQAEEN